MSCSLLTSIWLVQPRLSKAAVAGYVHVVFLGDRRFLSLSLGQFRFRSPRLFRAGDLAGVNPFH